jgi:ADP-dependent NAD(P)H-hydrate dehydratase
MTRSKVKVSIDASWRGNNPLPAIHDGLDKEARGRVLLVAGSAFVPGAPRLTGEALLRVGAGKVQIATIASQAPLLGMMMPEVAVIGVPADLEGEAAAETAAILTPRLLDFDVVVIGCGMRSRPHSGELVVALIRAVAPGCPVLVDAGAINALRGQAKIVHSLGGRIVMTPHHGELAGLLDRSRAAIDRDPIQATREAAKSFNATVVLKSHETIISAADGSLLSFIAPTPGLGTAGSGDVLAGAIGGLLARGADSLVAACWGVWLHGAAGLAAANRFGALGFLASDILRELPALVSVNSPN